MFPKISLLITLFCVGILMTYETSASVAYTPAPKIFLTGTTSDVRFDVALALHGSNFSGAYLDTTNRELEGAFYINGIGWALMSSGSSQVMIDCGGQSLSGVVSQCQFTGSGWSENIGEVGFASVRYNPSTATLSGTIASLAGEFSVDGSVLPLKSVQFNESLTSLVANHNQDLSIQDAWKYPHIIGGDSWKMELVPSSDTTAIRVYPGGVLGNFVSDISLADTYSMIVTDPLGSITTYDGVIVNPGVLTQNRYTSSTTLMEDFCTSPIHMALPVCPDGASLTATTIIKSSSTPTPIANTVDTYNIAIKLRDTYGNRITTGSVAISYTGTVSNIQIPMNIQSTVYPASSNWRDALIFSGDILPVWDMSGNWKDTLSNPITDIEYSITSSAPTDSTDNRIVLNTIVYTPLVGPAQPIIDSTSVDLEFSKPHIATLNAPINLRIAASNVFSGTFASMPSAPSNPELITLFKVGSGNLAHIDNLELPTIISEESPSTSWLMDISTTSHIVAASVAPVFALTGVYMPTTAYPELETVYYQGFVSYKIGATDILYPVFSGDRVAEYLSSNVKILGQNNARSEYGTIGTNANTRTSFVGNLRKTISLLNRGRTTYSDVEYIVHTTDTPVDDDDFTAHKTIIVIGADITITQDITKRDSPRAIIALTDTEGNGGNIIIAPGVTNVYAGIFAERALRSSGNNQLYVYGALVSGNTLGETAAGICPYYVQGTCNARDYDLEYIRTYDGSMGQLGSLRASDYPSSSLIIEYDIRLQTDPPPGLSE